MSIDNIKTSLDKLRSNLESSGTVDSELKTLLQSLDTDIQQLLKSPDTAAAAARPATCVPNWWSGPRASLPGWR